MAMMAAGIVFRWWAMRVLADYFTVDVSIRPDHRIVRDGPYRLLRHPSYTGALATFYGFALCLGDVVALLVVVVPVTLAFLWRIRVEEERAGAGFPRRLSRLRAARPSACCPASGDDRRASRLPSEGAARMTA